MLPENGSRIRWIKIEEKARKSGISSETVRKYLVQFQRGRLVRRVVSPEETPPGVYYQRAVNELVHDATAAFIEEAREQLGSDFEPMRHEFESFEAIMRSLDVEHKKLLGTKDELAQTREQGRLLIFYMHLFGVLYANVLITYSDIWPPEDAHEFLEIVVRALMAPFLRQIGKITHPILGRCKYSSQNAVEALTAGLGHAIAKHNAICDQFEELIKRPRQ